MKAIIIGAGLFLAGAAHAQQQINAPPAPPKWTILSMKCFPGQCAVRLLGQFASKEECMQSNSGRAHAEMPLPDGSKYIQRCEILLEGQP